MRYIFKVVLFFIGNALLAAPVSYKGSVYDLELVIYEKPILIKNCKIVSESEPPFWWAAYDALKNYKEFESYESWVKYFSIEYVEEYSIDADMFYAAQAQPQSELSMVPKRSALYGVLLKYDDREVFILKMYDSFIEQFEGDLDQLEGFSVTQVFEKQGGIWRNQSPHKIGEPFNFPYNNINVIEQLVIAGEAHFDEAAGAVAPILNEELKSFLDEAVDM